MDIEVHILSRNSTSGPDGRPEILDVVRHVSDIAQAHRLILKNGEDYDYELYCDGEQIPIDHGMLADIDAA
jgi:hypothetical protein